MIRKSVCVFAVLLLFSCCVQAGTQDLALHLLSKAGITKGICSLPDCGDGDLAIAVARQSDFLVHGQDTDLSLIDKAREAADKEGLLGNRVVLEKGFSSKLPYADRLIDLILMTDLTDPSLKDVSLSEIMRVLRPKGKAVIGHSKQSEGVLKAEVFKKWIGAGNVKDAVVSEDEYGIWAVITSPALKGGGSWTHWAHGPDNNPVSGDEILKWPFMTQWMAEPLYVTMPVITTIAGGRTFTATGHIVHHEREMPTVLMLTARNGYNGRVLWTRKLPTGYMVHRSAFIATEDIFYMIDGEKCLMLDPETGKEKGSIQIPGVGGELKWIAMEDGILYVLAGDSEEMVRTKRVRSRNSHWAWWALSEDYDKPWIPWGYGNTLAAYDLNKKKTLWTHMESKPVESRAVGISSGKLFFYCPNSRVGALDIKSGKLLWKNDEDRVSRLIEQLGQGLISVPGFKTTCMMVCSPVAIFIESQTRDNIVAISADNGKFLWKYKKTRNDPNMIFLDGKLIISGIEDNGGTYMMDPLRGTILKDLEFVKRCCTRMTACADAIFCRGAIKQWSDADGLGIYLRESGKYFIDGAQRPGCNDGAIPANGLLYVGPWLCDCNLSLIGTIVLTSAGDFNFKLKATDKERLEADANALSVKALQVDDKDWYSYRSDYNRSAGTKVNVGITGVEKLWESGTDKEGVISTVASSAGDLVFFCGNDGKVNCVDAKTGKSVWSFITAGPVMLPPSIWNGRVYVGSGDGYVYCLEAVTGRMLWRFRAAPVERRTMIYSSLCSTWPVNSGIVISNGTAYAAAGIVDRDGVYVYALDALAGKIKWQNNSSGHLNKDIHKGVSVSGPIALGPGSIWMPGGNQMGPVGYTLDSGTLIRGGKPRIGNPVAERGKDMGVFKDKFLMYGGRLFYDHRGGAVSPSGFYFSSFKKNGKLNYFRYVIAGSSNIPPAWNDEVFTAVTNAYRGLTCWSSKDIENIVADEKKMRQGQIGDIKGNWKPHKKDVLSLAAAGNGIVAVYQQSKSQWFVCVNDKKSGETLWEEQLPSEPFMGGLCIDRFGHILVTLNNGKIICYGVKK